MVNLREKEERKNMSVKFDTVGTVYIVTVLTKASRRFSIEKVFDNHRDASAYRDGINKLLSKDDPYVSEIIEMSVERKHDKVCG